MTCTSSIKDFLSGSLVTWLISCLEEPDVILSYDDLVDGVLLHEIFSQINPEPPNDEVVPSLGNAVIRTKNLNVVIDNIKQFYLEELGHLVLILPDAVKLGNDPESSIGEMKLLLLLLLGCAVQCPNKEKFITKIKDMDVDVQLAIVDCIKQVTDGQDMVITQESMENVNMGVLFDQIKRLIQQRDSYYEKWKGSACTSENLDSNELAKTAVDIAEMKTTHERCGMVKSDGENNHHYAVELAGWKSKVRKQRQELEEKTDSLLECKEEMELTKAALAKIKQENQELIHEARTAKSYRDELDAVIERAERADRLEVEVTRYKEKLADIEFYKTRIEEIREDNRVLMETREMLEEQLAATKRKLDKVAELESEIINYKQLLNDASLEREADKERLQEMCEENAQLRCISRINLNETAASLSMSDSEEPGTADNSLSEQLTNNAQTRALKLELENRRLVTLIDSLQENSLHESSMTVSELEKENTKLSLEIGSMNDKCERLTQQNKDLERICSDALQENKKFQESLNNKRADFNKQRLEIQSQLAKITDLERSNDLAIKEKQRVQFLQESAQKRADDLEKSLDLANKKLEELKTTESKLTDSMKMCAELQTKLIVLEREKENAQRDVNKHRLTIENKDIALDKASNEIEMADKIIAHLRQQVVDYNTQISRLRDMERSSKELDSRAVVDKETLEALQSDLIAEKLNTQHLATVLDKFGINVNMLLSRPTDSIIETISQVPEIINKVKKFISLESTSSGETSATSDSPALAHIDTVTEKNLLQNTVDTLEIKSKKLRTELTAAYTISDNLLAENAKLQVNITTSQSRNTSLTTQHTALQLANSQLVAEIEELLKERNSQQSTHAQLVSDQIALQSLHEGLNNEYEKLLEERELLKSALRDAKNEAKVLAENCQSLEAKIKTLQAEKEILINNTRTFDNLQGEHSELKEDFRNLFATTERLRSVCRNLQENHQSNKMETDLLSLKQIETNQELMNKDERCSYLEFEMSKLNQRCEMLLQINSGLDNDRRSLMDHVSLLLNQYHELLTNSLEDKEHYHTEEKFFTNKVNNLCRQKEKLEEKIMEHYRKLQSCSTKKKGFGASFVRRVRKAGSELLNKNRKSWAEDTKQSAEKTYESESGGNDSDLSADDLGLIREKCFNDKLRRDPVSSGYPKARRNGVYLTEEIPGSTTTLGDRDIPKPWSKGEEKEKNGSDFSSEHTGLAPFLQTCNNVSAVIDESRNIRVSEISPEKDAEAALIWYEYGCV